MNASERRKEGKKRFQLLSDTASKLLATDNPQGIVSELCQEVYAHLDCHAFFQTSSLMKKSALASDACAGIPEETPRRSGWLDYGVAVCGCAARDAAGLWRKTSSTRPTQDRLRQILRD